MFFHDFGFMDAVSGWTAGYRSGRACVNAELKVKDWAADSGGIKGVPIGLDDSSKELLVGGG